MNNNLKSLLSAEREECRRHQMIVASYAAMPIGMAKWLGKIWIYKNASL